MSSSRLSTAVLLVAAGLFSAGCLTSPEPQLPTSDDADSGVIDSGDGGSGDGGTDGGSSDGGSGDGGDDEDLDNDGWDMDQDCDDSDPDVNPGVTEDGCDGVDEDCDDLLDEDAPPDDYELADDDGGTDFGDLTGSDARWSSYLSPQTDLDTALFYVEDGTWDWFEIWIDVRVPTDVDLVLELWWYPDGGREWQQVEVMDDGGPGIDEAIDYGGTGGSDDSGWYALIISSAEGSSCQTAYIVEVEA